MGDLPKVSRQQFFSFQGIRRHPPRGFGETRWAFRLSRYCLRRSRPSPVRNPPLHGIDLSEPALEFAAKNLDGVPFEIELDQIDFVEALTKRPEPAHAAWCGLSIHHLSTDGKLRLFEAIHRSTKDFLMIYEPTLAKGEDRDSYLARFRRVNRAAWTFLTGDEWALIDHHVTTCDFPETAATWLDLGRQAGFSKAESPFLDPTASTRSIVTTSDTTG
jgi:hypothetical protein